MGPPALPPRGISLGKERVLLLAWVFGKCVRGRGWCSCVRGRGRARALSPVRRLEELVETVPRPTPLPVMLPQPPVPYEPGEHQQVSIKIDVIEVL